MLQIIIVGLLILATIFITLLAFDYLLFIVGIACGLFLGNYILEVIKEMK